MPTANRQLTAADLFLDGRDFEQVIPLFARSHGCVIMKDLPHDKSKYIVHCLTYMADL